VSIISAFDTSREIITPGSAAAKVPDFPEVFICVFSQRFAELFLKKFEMKELFSLFAGRDIVIYEFNYRGKRFGFYHTLQGGSASASLLEEMIAAGCKKILYFGSCGSLDKKIAGGHFLIPVSAYRDEGTSYHYVPASDYIEIKTAGRLAEIFEELKISYHKIRTWTIDAFYRETRNNMLKRKADGCEAVEMECASIMAVGQFRQREVYEFLYAADCLDGFEWDARILGNIPDDIKEEILTVALQVAVRL
jgi:uridine phosphorylase